MSLITASKTSISSYHTNKVNPNTEMGVTGLPKWREKVAFIIASNLRRIYRGWKVREFLLFERWIEINHAASIIQKAFRINRQKMENRYFIDAYLYAKHKKQILANYKLKQANKNNSKIQTIFNNECTYDENMAFWRSIVELRKAYRQYSTDVLIKALIENQNDLQGSIKTLGKSISVSVLPSLS